MIEKLKALGEGARNVLLFIVGPIAAVIVYIVYLIQKATDLKYQLEQSRAETQLAKTLTDKNEAENESNQSEGDYTTVRDVYEHEHGGSEPPKAS